MEQTSSDTARNGGLEIRPEWLPGPDTGVLPFRSIDRHRPGARAGASVRRTPGAALRTALDRTMIHWTLTYLAGCWLVLQLMDVLEEIWGWPIVAQRFVCVALGLGIVPALVVAWFHGDHGPQRVTGTEVALVGTILLGCGAVLWAIFGA